MKSKLTAADIAKLSGVSRATVFSVLGGKNGVSEKTRQRVLETVEKHGYESGLIPRALAGSMSTMVGVVLGSMKNPFWAELYSGMESVLSPAGFHTVLFNGTDESLAGSLTSFEQGKLPALRAYVIYGGVLTNRKRFKPFFDHLQRSEAPLITVNAHPRDLDLGHHIRYDIRGASREATEFLVKRGHRRIGCLAGPITSATAHDRYLGYIEALLAQHIEAADNLMVRAGETPATGYEAAMRMLTPTEGRPTAIICYNDQCAVGVYRACHDLRLRIPEDVSIIGFDGTGITEDTGPPMHTVSLFPEETGAAAGSLLLETVRGQHNGKPVQRVMRHKLIDRESVSTL